MFIQTENTPNPDVIKFIPEDEILKSGSMDFKSRKEAASSPFVRSLFAIEGVKSVYVARDFVSVTKDSELDWGVLKPSVLTTIMEHLVAGLPVMDEDIAEVKSTPASTINADDDEVVKQIKELIDTRVRPSVAEDGGDIIFHSFEDGVVRLEMHGACAGCPSSTVTLKGGIENMLKHYVPEVERVEAVNEAG